TPLTCKQTFSLHTTGLLRCYKGPVLRGCGKGTITLTNYFFCQFLTTVSPLSSSMASGCPVAVFAPPPVLDQTQSRSLPSRRTAYVGESAPGGGVQLAAEGSGGL